MFTLAKTPATNTLKLTVQGLMMRNGAGYDYQLSGRTITFEPGSAPPSGVNLIAMYQF